MVTQSGLNDTLIFSTNKAGTKLINMHIENIDIKKLASFEIHPRKRRLMQERHYKKFNGTVLLSRMT